MAAKLIVNIAIFVAASVFIQQTYAAKVSLKFNVRYMYKIINDNIMYYQKTFFR